MNTLLIVLLVAIVISALMLVKIFNKLVRLKNQNKNAFSQINVQLKRRYDLIPNLIKTAKAYMEHEKGTLEAVIEARNSAAKGLEALTSGKNGLSAENIAQFSAAEGMLQSAMSRFNVVMEAYPDLKANENMMQVSEELTSTENKISFARQAYNDSVMLYNEYKQSVPAVFVAGVFGHGEDAAFLSFADQEQIEKAPEVQF